MGRRGSTIEITKEARRQREKTLRENVGHERRSETRNDEKGERPRALGDLVRVVGRRSRRNRRLSRNHRRRRQKSLVIRPTSKSHTYTHATHSCKKKEKKKEQRS